jgi:hypothetical protein
MYQLKEKKGYTEDEAGAMMSNATALYVAESAGDVTKDGVLAWLGGSTDDLQNSASANTLGEASAIYALWIAYKGDDFDNRDGDTLLAMGDALSDEGFANWVRTDPAAQTELEAFQAAMSIINDAADEEEARQVLLANGFDDPELIALLTGLMGN